MKYFSFLLIAGCLSILAVSCKKKTAADTAKPSITFVEPEAGSTVYLSTDPEVHVEFTTTDDRALHTLNVLLIKNTNDTLMNQTPDVDNLTVYSFHEHAIPTGITVSTPFRVIVTARDQYGNTEQQTVNFFVEP